MGSFATYAAFGLWDGLWYMYAALTTSGSVRWKGGVGRIAATPSRHRACVTATFACRAMGYLGYFVFSVAGGFSETSGPGADLFRYALLVGHSQRAVCIMFVVVWARHACLTIIHV